MYSWLFWKDAAERALRSGAQAILLAIGASDLTPVDLFAVDWQVVSGFAAGGALLSILTSIIAAPVGKTGTASFIEQS